MQTSTLPNAIPLWPDSDASTDTEQSLSLPRFGGLILRNITKAALLPFLPDPARATGAAVIVVPGGGFQLLPIENEGTKAAEWLRERGVAAFVLKYRMMPTARDDAEFMQGLAKLAERMDEIERFMPNGVADATEAIRMVRASAAEWGIDPQRIGMLGFSGGGAISAGLISSYTPETRPDFAALLYTPALQEPVVPADAPPLFMALADDDALLPKGGIPFYSAWKSAGKPVELHVYCRGGHAFGMKQQGLPTDHWIERFGEWLQAQGIVN